MDRTQLILSYVEYCMTQMTTQDLQQFFLDRFYDECERQDPVGLMDDIEEYAPEILGEAWIS